MLNKIFALTIGLFFGFMQIFAQEAEEIIKKSLEARGDYNTYKDVKSLIIIGSQSQMGMSIPFSYYMKQIDEDKSKYRMESEGMGSKQVLAYNGDSVWIESGGNLQVVPDEYVEQILPQIKQIQGFVSGPLLNYKEKDYKIEYSGSVKEDDRDSYTLKMTDENDEETYLYIDKNNNELFKLWTTTTGRDGEPMEVTLRYSDFKIINGFALPHKMDLTVGEFGTTNFKIDKIEYNPVIDDSIFDAPVEEAEK
jgi:outer membrane lipoprotein-sorting protein